MRRGARQAGVVRLGLELLGATCVLAASAGCEGVLPEPDFERMQYQRGYRPFGESAHFADGRIMQPPPAGTIARGETLGQPALTRGVLPSGRYAAEIPVPLTRALLERGRERFDIFCAPCHGVRGDGTSMVASNMTLRRPPSLLEAPVPSFPPGRVFEVASAGYGLMPAYDSHLDVSDRWAVVAYVRALQRSQSVALADLPAGARARAEAALGVGVSER
ncbi:MAG TPA: cytochrome c [Polyangia bacterium]|nr:cytochrome c [Polyangia bacterium]